MKVILLVAAALLSVMPLKAKTLIAYYSFSGNTRTIVGDLRSQIDADVLEVEPAEEGIDYAANGYAIGSALIAAIRENPDDPDSYPAIRTTIDNLDDYDTIIVATPLWWSNMAAPMQTFLFSYGRQMAGKNIGLIVSSASSGISGVVADAERLIPDGNFLEPSLWIRSSQTSNCHSMISEWLDEINYDDLQAGVGTMDVEDAVVLSYVSGGIQLSGDFDEVSVYDITGRKVLESSGSFISTESLNTGAYVLVISSDGKTVSTTKVQINN